MAFASPVKQMIFALKEMANYSDLVGSKLWPDLDDSFVETLLNEAAKLADTSIAPLNQSADKAGSILKNGQVSTAPGFKEAYKELVNSSWGTVSGLKDYGGQGLPKTLAVMIQELWNTSCMSFSLCPMLTQGAIEAISHHGTDAQKNEYLPKLLTGEWSGTMNLTEPQAGSDVGALKTSAKRNTDGSYSIKGTKIYITHGDQDMSDNIIHLVLAKLPNSPEGVRGISLFLVPKYYLNDKGTKVKNDIKVVSVEHKLGHHASPTCVLSFGENEGAVGELVGEPNQGLKAMFTMMNNARLNVGVQGLAISERAYQKALSFSKERVQGYSLNKNITGPVEIIKHPDVKRMLMEMKSQTEAMRGLTITTGNFIDKYKKFPNSPEGKECLFISNLLTPIVKAWCTDQSIYITSFGEYFGHRSSVSIYGLNAKRDYCAKWKHVFEKIS